MDYFATAYTIHFDDTMSYGSHHFLTSFKFQCFCRESFLFGDRIYDMPGVREALEGIHLLTADAYARNLSPAMLGDRVAILLTIEDWQRASARFCYRVIGSEGTPICAGFQSLICADARTGRPVPLPGPLWDAMEEVRGIEEPPASESFRERVLAGGSRVESLFGEAERSTVVQYLEERHPSPGVIPALRPAAGSEADLTGTLTGESDDIESEIAPLEAWVFAGQGAFNAELLSGRVAAFVRSEPSARRELEECAAIAGELIGGDADAVVSGSAPACAAAVEAAPELSQFAIHLQNVLGARLRLSRGISPAVLIGHSFGELAAFGVAGCFDLPTGIQIVCRRMRAIAEHAPPNGALLAVMADRATILTEAGLSGLEQVVVAGRNHDRQTVVSGPRDQLEQFRDRLQKLDIKSVPVQSPTSFHHPRLRPAAAAWLEYLRTLPLAGPSRALFSPIGRRFISPHDDIAAVLASQLLRPFDFQGAISDVAELGVAKFVDCGSPGWLAKMIANTGVEDIEISGPEISKPVISKPVISKPVISKTATVVGSSPRATRSPESSHPEPADPEGGGGLSGDSRESKPGPAGTPPRWETGGKDARPAVAIVGQGCILPGGASSPRQLFAAITEQRSGIVDERRFDPHWEEDFYSEKLVPDRSTSHLNGRIEDHEIVAPAGVDQGTFNRFSRAQRLLCIALAPCAESLADAERVMCLIGATADGFENQDAVSVLRLAGIDPTNLDVDARMNTALSAFEEPYDAVREVFDRIIRPGLEIILVDAACASSLYSVALGMRALETGKADAVLAGGVFCPGAGTSCLFSQFRSMTATGCRPFDANADGVVFSEGAAVVALRRVADATRLGLPVAAVVRGVGISSDGRSPSANVPQTRGQILSLERCYRDYGIDPASIDAIEGHGTSTPVGDNTELETLRQFFSDHLRQPVPLHSLKGLLGHAGWAAGTASIIAACEYLRNGVFPAQANHRVPSETLVRAAATLSVLKQAQPLPPGRQRIAIDGFGFGGANAHVVLENHAAEAQEQSRQEQPLHEEIAAPAKEDELVFVAAHEVVPTLSTESGPRFDRERVNLPKGHIILPELVDDMDVTQKLAIILLDGIVAKLPNVDDALKRETAVLLAQSGKTERGVGATLRVLAPRLRRRLAGLDHILDTLAVAGDAVRPSGPYTLQCMMPNVAAGRGALQMNLNGPNFVVDAGRDSLESAFAAASLLLGGGDDAGTKLVIVTAINANSWRVPDRNFLRPEGEFAAAFAVTSRRHAEELGLDVIASVEKPLETSLSGSQEDGSRATTERKVRRLLDRLQSPEDTDFEVSPAPNIPASEKAEFPIHAPVWVEVPGEARRADPPNGREPAIMAIVPARRDQVVELAETLPNHARRYRIVVTGDAAGEVVSQIDDPNVTAAPVAAAPPTAAGSIDKVLAEIGRFGPDVVIAIESVVTWDRVDSLTAAAKDNSLCELLFLIAQDNAARLTEGKLELWGLFPGAFSDAVHPVSGPVAGLLKAIGREIPAARVGVVCTRDRSIDEALECLSAERSRDDSEWETAYDGRTRLARRLREVRLGSEPAAKLELNSDSVVVATGGARGITAVLTKALLEDYGCTVVTLGRSAALVGPKNADDPEVEREFYARFMRQHPGASPVEMRREFEKTQASWEVHATIAELSGVGGHIEYLVTDVMDRDQVASVVRQIASKYGRIDLLVHGAGVQVSTRLENRSLADFRRTFSVKVGGLCHLAEQCREQLGETPAAHVLTSAYSIFGNDGQHDYGAANETLDRLCGISGFPTRRSGVVEHRVACLGRHRDDARQ